MADIYYRTDASTGITIVYLGNNQTDVQSSTKWTTSSGAICNRNRACVVGSSFELPENVTNLFYGVSMFINTSLSMDKWDTSKCTNMSNMFAASYLYDVDLSSWDLSKVTNMSSMFKQCPNLQTVKIDTSTPSLTNTNQMFSNGGAAQDTGMILESVSLKGFDVSHVTNLNSMFQNCYKLSSIIVDTNTDWKQDLPSGVVPNNLFVGCSKLPNWDGGVGIDRANTNWYFTGHRNWKSFKLYMKV